MKRISVLILALFLTVGIGWIVTNVNTDSQDKIFDARVERGVALLNDHLPGWQKRITREVIIDSPIDCILGQIYGSYRDGLDTLEISGDGVEYGFILLSSEHESKALRKLERAWKKKLKKI